MADLIHTYADSIVTLGHVKTTIQQNRRHHIVGCLDVQYRKLKKNVY